MPCHLENLISFKDTSCPQQQDYLNLSAIQQELVELREAVRLDHLFSLSPSQLVFPWVHGAASSDALISHAFPVPEHDCSAMSLL